VWLEECARAQVSPYVNLQGLVLAGEAILRSGTDEQRRRFLPPTLTGELLWCQLFSEPGAGSDLTSLTTSAVADGDRYVIDGAKVWSSNAQHAEYGILLARTDPGQRGHRGISFFLLDMATPGVGVRPIWQMTATGSSARCSSTASRCPRARGSGPRTRAGAWPPRSCSTSAGRAAQGS
jgi:alkylation response protein AidB-like acyl-CoA dehydrogenase